MIPTFDLPGEIKPGQFGPINFVPVSTSRRDTRIISFTGTPSVMHTTSAMPALADSRLASAHPRAGP
jgi:hypothetical protein